MIGNFSERRFNGVITNDAAFQIGRFVTMAHFLNERANSSWVHYKPVQVDFDVHQDEETGFYCVSIRLLNTTRSVSRQLDSFSTREDAWSYVKAATKLELDNPI